MTVPIVRLRNVSGLGSHLVSHWHLSQTTFTSFVNGQGRGHWKVANMMHVILTWNMSLMRGVGPILFDGSPYTPLVKWPPSSPWGGAPPRVWPWGGTCYPSMVLHPIQVPTTALHHLESSESESQPQNYKPSKSSILHINIYLYTYLYNISVYT